MSADTTSPRDRIESALHLLSLRQKVRLLTGASFWATHPDESIGLGALSLSDGPAGVRGGGWDERRTSLLLPCPAALAATWDGDLAREYGAVLGRRARAAGVHVLLAPTVNLQRSPRGGRNFESMGEDPVLAARMAVGYVTGVQSVGVAATVKHFAGNEVETNRMRYDVRASIDLLRATYLLPFESSVREAGAWAVMAAYNAVNGSPMTENQELLDGVLREDWGFDGLVVSDWGATVSTVPSAEASLDLVMPGPDGPWAERLLDAVRRGEVDADVIDAKVRRLLRLAERVGAWPVPGPEGDADRHDPVDRDADDTLARQFAAAGSVLLKHTGVLPLSASAHRRVALIGSAALHLTLQGGGSAHVEPERRSTLVGELATALGPDVHIDVVAGPAISRYAPDIAELSSDPSTGEPGIRLEYVDGEGHTVESEHRSRGRLVLLPDDLPRGACAVRIRAQVRVDVDGEHGLELCGSGTFDVQVPGSLSEHVVIAGPSDDPVWALSKPPSQCLPLPLLAGSVVDIDIIHPLPSDSLVALRVGWAPPESSRQDVIAKAARAAASCDVAIVVVGTTDEVESEGFDRPDLSLPAPQDDLVRVVANANPRTIVVVNAGSPVLLPWADDCAEIVWAWLPGQAGAAAIADVLTGAAEPAGRLPMTIPHPGDVDSNTLGAGDDLDYDAQPEIGYRRYASGGTPPHFPFGFGLGYTTWTYESATLDADATSLDVTITNTGQRRGREVVQCYAAPTTDPAEPPRLVGFASATADAGSTVTVSVPLDLRPMSTWDSNARAWAHSPVGWDLIVGRHVGDERFRVAYP